MRINTIIENLERYAPKSYINNEDITFVQSAKYVENAFIDFVPNMLYVGEISNLPISYIDVYEANFLIISKDELVYSISNEMKCNIIFISSNSIASVFNSILDIFCEYKELSYSSSRLLDAISQVPIYLKSPNSRFNDWGENKNKLTENSKSVLYINSKKNSKFAESRIWANIYNGNKLLGQAVILETFKPFTESDIALINQLTRTISIELQKHKYYETTNADNRDLLILDLLNEKIKNQEAINENLKFADWNLKESMRAISITMKKEKISLIKFRFIRNFLKNIFHDSICVLYDGNIVIVINYISDKAFLKVYSNKLNDFLNDQNMVCGISRTFSNLMDINRYYKQSLKAIELGEYLNADKFIFFYDSYILQHIFSLCSDHDSLKEFCHPSIFKLIDYDKKYNTDYLKTLYLYIINFKNQTELGKLMHVHRNTLYYRISKIEEIININLSNIDEFVGIYLSFKILGYIGEKFS